MKTGFNFNQWGIRSRILFLAIVPVLLTSLLVGYFLTVIHVKNQQENLERVGESVARGLSKSAEFALLIKDITALDALLKSAFIYPDIEKVSILDTNGHIVIEKTSDTVQSEEAGTIFRCPIVSSEIPDDGMEEIDPLSTVSRPIGLIEVVVSKESLKQSRSRFIQQVILTSLLGLGFALLVALLAARTLIPPLLNILNVIDDVSKGRLSTSLKVISGGEVGRLEKGVNKMVTRIARAKDDLDQQIHIATSALEATVGKLRQQNIELDKSRKEAIQAGKAKEQFLAQISHEIRTPLTSIVGFCNLLRGILTTHAQREYVDIIRRSGDQLHGIINDVLCFSELQAAKVRVSEVDFDLLPVVEEVLLHHSPQAHAKNLEILFLPQGVAPTHVSADPDRLSQVLNNLINNAIKFTEHGHVVVTIGCEPGSTEATVCVSDTGIGISEDIKEQLFDPFVQGDGSIRKRFGGNGLGLTISKMLVERMRGRLWISSDTEHGAKFCFSIPLSSSDYSSVDYMHDGLIGKKLLIAESSALSRKYFQFALLYFGVEVFSAPSLDDAIDMMIDAERSAVPYDGMILGLSRREADELDPVVLSNIAKDLDVSVLTLIGDEAVTTDLSGQLNANPRLRIATKPITTEKLFRTLTDLMEGSNNLFAHDPAAQTMTISFFANTTALIAEDNEFSRKLLRITLERAGICVHECGDGEQAVRKAHEHTFDIIFLDIHMPHMDGYVASQQISETAKNRHTPIVALTADVFVNSESEEFSDIMIKPVSTEALQTVLSKFLAGKKGGVHSTNGKSVNKDKEPLSDTEFIDALRDQLNKVMDVAEPLNREALKSEIHQLNGIAAYFSEDEITRIGQYIERNAKSIDPGELASYLSYLDDQVDTISQSLFQKAPIKSE